VLPAERNQLPLVENRFILHSLKAFIARLHSGNGLLSHESRLPRRSHGTTPCFSCAQPANQRIPRRSGAAQLTPPLRRTNPARLLTSWVRAVRNWSVAAPAQPRAMSSVVNAPTGPRAARRDVTLTGISESVYERAVDCFKRHSADEGGLFITNADVLGTFHLRPLAWLFSGWSVARNSPSVHGPASFVCVLQSQQPERPWPVILLSRSSASLLRKRGLAGVRLVPEPGVLASARCHRCACESAVDKERQLS
jgi:hypothetical protein